MKGHFQGLQEGSQGPRIFLATGQRHVAMFGSCDAHQGSGKRYITRNGRLAIIDLFKPIIMAMPQDESVFREECQ